MLNCKSSWARIADQEEDHFCRIHAWKTDNEGEGKTIAIVDMLTGRVIYLNQEARKDPVVQNRIRSVVERAGKNHPYSIERLESILCSVVDYECEEGPENGRWNLEAMGFDEEEMIFFGFPPSRGEEERQGKVTC